jgi:uncharacterized protein YbaP (TraB family)
MKFILTVLLFSFSVLTANSQPAKKAEKKYQGLLWEITGNGLARPSYLFGTMHVSNKLAFHLADSFFTALKSVDMVALETNPTNWQDDYSKSNSLNTNARVDDEDFLNQMLNIPNDYIKKNTFAIDKYENNLKLALATEPAMINGMLYRTYNSGADFEEDTYLDMYIFQTGKKLGKKLAGVENFEESEKLVEEAYKDAAKERRNSKQRYDEEDSYDDRLKNPFTIEDAYRRGDLDMLDSLEIKQFNSKAFLEKFLYKRNEIQANAIDSIIKNKTSLFAGVGSAHLPGNRGVIEMLRKKGYKLRAVKIGGRDGQYKDAIDKIRVPVSFKTIQSDDGSFSVDIPGDKLYSFTKFGDLNTKQFADMGNGAYYVISRVKTNGMLLGEDVNTVYKKVDSMLYENIPGKILKKTAITKNNFKGFDIINRTRRGDVQRYNIIVTPFEIFIFKVSGIGDYVQQGKEASRFLNSINFKPAKVINWQTYQPATGGFELKMPHTPLLQKDFGSNRLEYTAYDAKENITYSLFKVSIHNYGFIEEDTFDLNLMEESFASSAIIEKQILRQAGIWQGYPVLDCKYKHKDGSFSSVRYLLQGPNYYVQVAHYKTPAKNVKQYFDSFRIVPFIYPEVKMRVDTAMKFTVKSPLFPAEKKSNDILDAMRNMMGNYGDDDREDLIPKFAIKSIGNDTIGEKIFVAYVKIPKNSSAKDSSEFFDNSNFSIHNGSNQSYLYLKKDSGITASGLRYMFREVTDTGSSRIFIAKSFYKAGHFFSVITQADTLTPKSSLLANFIETFTPADTLSSESPFVKRNVEFFKNYASKDSATHAKALKQLNEIEFEAEDAPKLKKIIDTLTWKSKDYLQLKQNFIGKLDVLKDSSLVNYLEQIYTAVKDTADLQRCVLQTLLRMQTKKSFIAFKNLILAEPPVVSDGNGDSKYDEVNYNNIKLAKAYEYKKISFNKYSYNWYPLYDTLSLAKVIFPDILQLINLDDYKGSVVDLLTTMVDSNYADAKNYEPYFTKFFSEAKQELKKEKANENQKSIAIAEKANKADEEDEYAKDEKEQGNELLQRYAVLLLPYWDKNPGVPAFFEEVLKLKNKETIFNVMLLLLRNKKVVSDVLINSYAADESYRIDLYRKLKKAKLLDKFPGKYSSQADLVKSALISNTSYYNKYDTLVLLDKLPVSYKDKKGMVYFFKYKNKKEEKKWKIVSFGLQPENANEFDDDNEDFIATGSYSRYGREEEDILDETKPVKEQLQKILKTTLYKMHRSAARFFEFNNDAYQDILTERIKTNRFGD